MNPPDAPGQEWVARMGANPRRGEVGFAVWAPFATTMFIELTPVAGKRSVFQMERERDGFFSYSVDAQPSTRYSFVIDGKIRRPDPVSRFQPSGVHGPSEIVDPDEFAWTDRNWSGLAQEDLLIYEIHVGTFTPGGTFDSIVPHLDRLRRLGISAIELMPVGQFPGERNWGYDGVDIYAPQNSYGGPSGLKRLVNACHETGLAILLDVVYNHIGPEGNYLADFGPYFSGKYRTPWGPAMNYDDGGCDQVRRFVLDNALYWVTEFHFDGLRLDAVHGIFDFSPRNIMKELAEAVHSQEPFARRRLHVIAESDLNDPKIVAAEETGGFGLDAQWSDDFHHSVHAFLTGERFRHYQDFGSIKNIEKSLRNGFVYDGKFSKFRQRTHGAPSKDLPGEKFVFFLQNHDQVGNRPDGARLSSLVGPSALKAAVGLLLLAPNIPLLFMGEEYGETSPFYYFVSHSDPGLVKAVRDGRRREVGVGGLYKDPQSESTFEESKLNQELRLKPRNRGIYRYYGDLMRFRSEHPAIRSMDRRCMEVRAIGRTILVRRWAPSVEELLLVCAMGEGPPRSLRSLGGKWLTVFDSSYRGGVGRGQPRGANSDLRNFDFQPYGFTVFSKAAHGSGPESGAGPAEGSLSRVMR